jgi:dienelactone hydrolase
MRLVVLTLVLLLGITPGAEAVPPLREVARTWDGALLFLQVEDPDYRLVVLDGPVHAPFMRRAMERADPRTLRGVIIHLHGCSYDHHDMDVRSQARFMASLGYAVIVPNSFRRLNRPPTCDPVRRMGLPRAPYLDVQRMRQEELSYAIVRVLELHWGRPDRIYVSGYSEGGDAVVDFSDPRVRGRIAIGSSCWLGTKTKRGPPMLIITAANDLWYSDDTWPQARGLCRRRLSGVPSVQVLEPDGALHNALIYWESQTALWNFLVRSAYAY